METPRSETSTYIASCLELAILLESSAHKPGNISIVTNFENTRYEHFLASAVAATPCFEKAAGQGTAISRKKISEGNAGIGNIIKACVKNINVWQHGGNTLLGTIMLLTPLAVAAGMTLEDNRFKLATLRRNLKAVIESTTPEDSVGFYDAIEIAKPGGLGRVPDLDVNNPSSRNKILKEHVSLYKICKIAEGYDTLCSEWTSGYRATFEIAHPFLTKQLEIESESNDAIVQTFLKVLAQVPDTFIARKAGINRATEVSAEAQNILELGGIQSSSGRQRLADFDHRLRMSGNLLNPGTTADIIAAALALCILEGYRP